MQWLVRSEPYVSVNNMDAEQLKRDSAIMQISYRIDRHYLERLSVEQLYQILTILKTQD